MVGIRNVLWYTGRVVERYKRKPNASCLVCGKDVYRRPIEIKRNNGRVFCSVACYGKSCRKETPCLICGKPILAGFHRKTCSRSCSNKYREGIKYKLNSPRDKVKTQGLLKIRLLKIRGKKCERCGFGKYEILQVHHKNKNRNNNDLDNLELICPNCHSEEHYFDNSWVRGRY
ncbi:MAG TPA: HNH endonuclease [Patescibacteria group bacterium]|nr:HNH endonuclease [Patescibacteria group bacterium]